MSRGIQELRESPFLRPAKITRCCRAASLLGLRYPGGQVSKARAPWTRVHRGNGVDTWIRVHIKLVKMQ